MSFDNIPAEMREFPHWIVWRLEYKVDGNGIVDTSRKPTKVPYQPWPGGKKAAANRPNEWGTYGQATSAPIQSYEPVDPNLDVADTGFSGIGFMFSDESPYSGIDLDDTHGDTEAYNRQVKIFSEFNSYSELSPSGSGLHIIVKGKVPFGRRRASIELYPRERFFTMTGNVQNPVPIAERQQLLELLFEQMGGDATIPAIEVKDQPQSEDDDLIIARALNAANGEKFTKLLNGEWEGMYASQSEADFAFVDIVAFYSKNSEQIRRIFRASALGQTPKDNYAHRGDRAAYVEYMVRKSFDRQLPELDVEVLANLRKQWAAENAIATKPPSAAPLAGPSGTVVSGSTGDAPPMLPPSGSVNTFPPGLLGQVAQFILDAAPRPVPEIALAGAIAMMSGITGRAYNTYTGAGLNQYCLLLAPTGTGKDSMQTGIGKLFQAIQSRVPSAIDFRGPGEIASAQGLLRWLEKKPCVVSVLGEIGLLMQQMALPNANANQKGLERALLQLYSKSGKDTFVDPSAYSDQQKNTAPIRSPSFTMIGETVPHCFYESMDESFISSGLLPRFTLFEYKGERPYLQEGKEFVQPPFQLVQQLSDLMANCLNLMNTGNTQVVPCNTDALETFRNFERYTTDEINSGGNSEIVRQLWNRAHLKALKLASVYAIGINPYQPTIDMSAAMWATNLIVQQTRELLFKFENNEIGGLSIEKEQVDAVIKAIKSFLSEPWDKYAKYGGSEDQHRDGIITQSHLQRRLVNQACFRNDKFGATNGLKRAVQHLLDGDDIREMPVVQMQAKYGNRSRGFMMSNRSRFVD